MDKLSINDMQVNKLLNSADKIFFYCVKRCNSKSDAEDLSQDILLDILININKGIKINNFDYYIWKICKNHYSKYINSKVTSRNNFVDNVDIDEAADNINILEDIIKSEEISSLNRVIKTLSSDYSEILYSYYIEDRTLAYISNELNLPLGTVKRRLFDIRNKLKEYLKMERLNGKKAFVPKKFSTVKSGGGSINPHGCTKSLINKNLLFHSYDNPCTLEDYALELGIAKPYIEEIVNELVQATLLTKSNNKYITNFPIISKELITKLNKVIKDESNNYTNVLVIFCKKYFSKFKEIVNNDHFDDNELMWVFMFIINRFAETYFVTKNDEISDYVGRHKDSGGSWDFHMVEDYDKEIVYFISENWFGNNNYGIKGISHPSSCWTTNDELFNTISYSKSLNGSGTEDIFRLDYIEYVIKNPNMKYSEVDKSNLYKIDFLVKNNYLYIENDEIKFNFVLFSKEQYNTLNNLFKYHEELNGAKEEKNNLINKLKEVIINYLPNYLSIDADYLADSQFCGSIREYVIRSFFHNGLIKPVNKEGRFNFNMYAWIVIE
ncbi:MAG: sigma-70 family RNA polymerase sigma factor [Bacilli bacterium]